MFLLHVSFTVSYTEDEPNFPPQNNLILQQKVSTILDKNVKKNARCMINFRILPPKARFTQDTPPFPPKKQC